MNIADNSSIDDRSSVLVTVADLQHQLNKSLQQLSPRLKTVAELFI